MTNRHTFGCRMTRRSLLGTAGMGVFGGGVEPRNKRGAAAPAAPVALGRCAAYGAELLPALSRMFDQIGGLGRIAKGKTVAVKINLTGNPDTRLGYLPIGLTTWTHPSVIAATVHLLGRAGARRIRQHPPSRRRAWRGNSRSEADRSEGCARGGRGLRLSQFSRRDSADAAHLRPASAGAQRIGSWKRRTSGK